MKVLLILKILNFLIITVAIFVKILYNLIKNERIDENIKSKAKKIIVDEYKENENLTKEQFYELLKNSDAFPKTSQPTPYDFEVLLEEFMENGDECIIITISSALSGTYQNAFLVKNMLPIFSLSLLKYNPLSSTSTVH